MSGTITLTAEEYKQLFGSLFEVITNQEKLITRLSKELEERDALISKMEDESRVVPLPLDWDEEEWKAESDAMDDENNG